MFKKQSVDIGGATDPGFENVKKVFEENFVNGNEISAQLCIVKNGKIVSTIPKVFFYISNLLTRLWTSGAQ